MSKRVQRTHSTKKSVRGPPAWLMPAEGTARQKMEWRSQMLHWTFDRLDEKSFLQQKGSPEFDKWFHEDGPALEAAHRGDVTDLRKRYPRLAPFLHPPKLGRGQKWKDRRPAQSDPLRRVAKLVREIWREHYGRQNRGADDAHNLSAEDIAGLYLGMKSLAGYLKAHGLD